MRPQRESYKVFSQQKAFFVDCLQNFINSDNTVYTLSGVAGSGKTHLLSILIKVVSQELNSTVTVSSFTGKACSVARERLKEKGMQGTTVATLHSLFYRLVEDPETLIKYFVEEDGPVLGQGELLVIDEASMVPMNMMNHVFRKAEEAGAKVLLVGDKQQLPPVGNNKGSVLDEYDFHLDQPLRGVNDIVDLSNEVNTNNKFNKNLFKDSNSIHFYSKDDSMKQLIKTHSPDVILCGTNKKRRTFNSLVRSINGFYELIEPNERIICLKNSYLDENKTIYNGETFRVVDVREHDKTHLSIAIDDNIYDDEDFIKEPTWTIVPKDCFENDINNPFALEDEKDKYHPRSCYFTYGYAMSVWKSQASEYDTVLFYDENVSFFSDQKKFRYTAVTRAKNQLIVVA